jgi:hypothetical protein
MGARTDAALSLLALAGFLLAIRVADTDVSVAYLALGAVGTLAFELLALPRQREIYAVWNRPAVQIAALALTAVVILAGLTTAPSPVLSAGAGALVAYLALLGAVALAARLGDRS